MVNARAVSRDLLMRMAGALAHRGPDDGGVWTDHAAGIGLAHRRLSIVDLSPLGHQPMASHDGRWMIAFNGEIYNHLEMRREIENVRSVAWCGNSDTETLVECIAHWGIAHTLERAVGMFAIALWDRRERELSLARDRFGEKPLFYGWVGGDFMFASELSPLRLHPRFDNSVSREALRSLASLAYVAEPLSIYKGIFKLPPGTILSASASALSTPRSAPPSSGTMDAGIRIERYWSYPDVVAAGLANPIRNEAEALDAVESALKDAIAGQAVADVPVGAFLSGGIDSSLVVALYQKLWPGKVKTFTIGFSDRTYDEAPFARQLSNHLGTEHQELYVSVDDALAVIPKLPTIYDEPFADSSQIPTYIVSKLAREKVTVALSGDGGDELFAGYNRYFGTIRMWEAMQRLPDQMRLGIGRVLAAVPPPAWNALAALRPGGARPEFFGSRVQKVFHTMGRARRLEDFAAMFLDEWSGANSPVIDAPAARPFGMDLGADAPAIARMMCADALTYLPGDILAKVDRAAMANSLETRVPFLDHRVAAVAARVPLSMKISGGSGKMILRKLLFRHVPAEFFNRPKAGFAVPIEQWLRGPLRDWAESLLDPRRLREEGYFDPTMVRERWGALLEGRSRSASSIWAVLMMQAWLDQQHNCSSGSPPAHNALQSTDSSD